MRLVTANGEVEFESGLGFTATRVYYIIISPNEPSFDAKKYTFDTNIPLDVTVEYADTTNDPPATEELQLKHVFTTGTDFYYTCTHKLLSKITVADAIPEVPEGYPELSAVDIDPVARWTNNPVQEFTWSEAVSADAYEVMFSLQGSIQQGNNNNPITVNTSLMTEIVSGNYWSTSSAPETTKVQYGGTNGLYIHNTTTGELKTGPYTFSVRPVNLLGQEVVNYGDWSTKSVGVDLDTERVLMSIWPDTSGSWYDYQDQTAQNANFPWESQSQFLVQRRTGGVTSEKLLRDYYNTDHDKAFHWYLVLNQGYYWHNTVDKSPTKEMTINVTFTNRENTEQVTGYSTTLNTTETTDFIIDPAENNKENGTYNVNFQHEDAAGNLGTIISDQFMYLSTLDTVRNLALSGDIGETYATMTWDAVEYAEKYEITYVGYGTYTRSGNTNTSHDFYFPEAFGTSLTGIDVRIIAKNGTLDVASRGVTTYTLSAPGGGGGGGDDYDGDPEAPEITWLGAPVGNGLGFPEWSNKENGDAIDGAQTQYYINGIAVSGTYNDPSYDDMYGGSSYRQYVTTRREDPGMSWESYNFSNTDGYDVHGWNTIQVRVLEADGNWTPWSKKVSYILDLTDKRPYDENYNYIAHGSDPEKPNSLAPINMAYTQTDTGVPTITWDLSGNDRTNQSRANGNIPWTTDEADLYTQTSPEDVNWEWIGGEMSPDLWNIIHLYKYDPSSKTIDFGNYLTFEDRVTGAVREDNGYAGSSPHPYDYDIYQEYTYSWGTSITQISNAGISISKKTFTPLYDMFPTGNYIAFVFSQSMANFNDGQTLFNFNDNVNRSASGDYLYGLPMYLENPWNPNYLSGGPDANLLARYTSPGVQTIPGSVAFTFDVAGWDDTSGNNHDLTVKDSTRPPRSVQRLLHPQAETGESAWGSLADFGDTTNISGMSNSTFNHPDILGIVIVLDIDNHIPEGASSNSQRSAILANIPSGQASGNPKQRGFNLFLEYGQIVLQSTVFDGTSTSSYNASRIGASNTGPLICTGFVNQNTGFTSLSGWNSSGMIIGNNTTNSLRTWDTNDAYATGLTMGQTTSEYPLNGKVIDVVLFDAAAQFTAMGVDPHGIYGNPLLHRQVGWAWDFYNGTTYPRAIWERTAGWLNDYWVIGADLTKNRLAGEYFKQLAIPN